MVRDHRDVLSSTAAAVIALALDHPDWIPVLQAACAVAKQTENFGGQFAGRWVLQEWQQQTGEPQWQPGLKRLVAYGLIDPVGESTRGGKRRYYRMPDRAGVERALQELAKAK
jgi:hypothetical protein